MLIVVVGVENVESMLRVGEGPALSGSERCPACGGSLGPWGSYTRLVRWGAQIGGLVVCRSHCRSCGVTHALLPAFLLARRLDLASAIGLALAFGAAGRGYRPVALALGVPETTARSWLRRLRARAGALRSVFVRLVGALGQETARPPPSGCALRWLLEAIVAAHQAALRRFGGRTPPCVWAFSSAASGGLLASNTDVPW